MNRAFVYCLLFYSTKIILIILLTTSNSSGLTPTERTITKVIIEKFKIKHCILVSPTENKINSFNDYKLMSKWNILTNLKSPKELHYYINQYLCPHITPGEMGTSRAIWNNMKKLDMPKTLIVLQNATIDHLEDLFYSYKNDQTAGYFLWIAFLKESQFLTTSNNIRVPYNAEFIAICKINKNQYQLMETYRVKEVQFVSNFGSWDPENGLITHRLTFIQRRVNLNGTVLYASKWSLTDDKTLTSYHEEILQDVSRMINARIVKVQTPEEDVTVQGILYTMSAFTYTKDLSGPLLKIKSYAYIKEPKISVSSIYFVLPLHKHAWLTMILILAVTSFLFTFFYVRLKDQLKKEKMVLIDYVFKTFETYCNQSGSIEPKSCSIRALAFIIRLLIVITFSAYSGTLLSYLLLRTPQAPFESLEELVENTSFSVGCNEVGYEYHFFQMNPDPFYNKIFRNLIENKVTSNSALEFNRVCNGNHAHIASENDARMYKACKLFQIRNLALTRLTSIYFFAYSGGIRSLFSYKLLWFYPSGILNRMQKQLERYKIIDSPENFLPVEADHITYVMYILASGIILSFLIFVVELYLTIFTEMQMIAFFSQNINI